MTPPTDEERLVEVLQRAQSEGSLGSWPINEVIAHARAHLAGFKTPKYVVVVDQLPKNPSGKILKRQLRDDFAHVAKD